MSDWPETFDITLTNPTAAQYVKAVRDLAKVAPKGIRGDRRVNVRVIGRCSDCYPGMFEDM